MAEAEFTPGPWSAAVCDDGYAMVHTGGDVICNVDFNHAPNEPADLANARLVAAAPDLFAACKALLTDLTSPFPREALVMASIGEGSIPQARAALAKALGEAA